MPLSPAKIETLWIARTNAKKHRGGDRAPAEIRAKFEIGDYVRSCANRATVKYRRRRLLVVDKRETELRSGDAIYGGNRAEERE